MRIAIDAMGGDFAPREIIHGAFDGLRFIGPGDELLLYGPKERVEGEMAELGLSDARVRVVPCSQVIEMDESPVEALRQKRDSSIVQMTVHAGKGQSEAVISAGNTGAFAAACHLKIGLIDGVSRPGIAVSMPTFHGPVVICDVGANPAPKPHHLYEYARMSAAYAKFIHHKENPRVGLASIGEEDGKGNTLVKETHALLRDDKSLNFVGNMEGRDLFAGECDVFVCDGFVGNIILKLTESLAEGLFKTIRQELRTESEALVDSFRPIVDRIWGRHDFAEYGGAPLLGLNGVGIICHGRSDRKAIANSVRVAVEQLRIDLRAIIKGDLRAHPGNAA